MQFLCCNVIIPRAIVVVCLHEDTAVSGIGDIDIDELAIVGDDAVGVQVRHGLIVVGLEIETFQPRLLVDGSVGKFGDTSFEHNLVARAPVRVGNELVIEIVEDTVARGEVLVERVHIDVLDGRAIERMWVGLVDFGRDGHFLQAGATTEGIASDGGQCVRQLHLFKMRKSVELSGEFGHAFEESQFRESFRSPG